MTEKISKMDGILDELSVSVNDISRAVIDLQNCFSALRGELVKEVLKPKKVSTPEKKNTVTVKKVAPSQWEVIPEKISLKGKVSYKDEILYIDQIPKTSDVEIGYVKRKENILMNKSTLLSLFNKLPEKFTSDDVKELVKKSPKIRIDNNNLKTPYLIMWFYILIFHKNCKKISGKKDKLRIQKL